MLYSSVGQAGSLAPDSQPHQYKSFPQSHSIETVFGTPVLGGLEAIEAAQQLAVVTVGSGGSMLLSHDDSGDESRKSSRKAMNS